MNSEAVFLISSLAIKPFKKSQDKNILNLDGAVSNTLKNVHNRKIRVSRKEKRSVENDQNEIFILYILGGLKFYIHFLTGSEKN